MNLLNKIPHWLFVGLAMAAGAFVQSLQGDSNLFAEIFAKNWTALLVDAKTAGFVGLAALIGYLKTDPWTAAANKLSAAKKAPTVPPLAMLVLFGGLLGGGSLIATGIQGCKQAETAIIQSVDAACTVLDSQPEPAWVYFTCAVLDSAGNIINRYTAKVPADQAKEFALKHSSAAKVAK